MKSVSVRDFQLHASKLLKELPLELTVYKKPVAVVLKANLSTPQPVEPVQEKKELTEMKLEPQQAPQIPIGMGIAEAPQIPIEGSIPASDFPYKPKSPNTVLPKKTWDKESLDKLASLEPPKSSICQIPVCKKPSVGEFSFYVYNDGEEVKLTKSLCAFHKVKVEREQPI